MNGPVGEMSAGRVWRWVRGFARFWYRFIVGDDWRLAASVVAALVGAWALHLAHVRAWWLVPAVVVTAIWVVLATRDG